MFKLPNIMKWLRIVKTVAPGGKYRHRLLVEDKIFRESIIAEFQEFVYLAHEDARNHLRQITCDDLDPLSPPSNTYDPAAGYPESLELQTLKGYFGEIFAGAIAENLAPFDHDDWVVPAFSFRFHQVAFDQLELWRQTGKQPGKIPGRTGDDMVAFRRDVQGKIIASLLCEAKCTKDHDTEMIAEAHTKVSNSNLKPIEIRRLIEILNDYPDTDSIQWANSLRHLFFSDDLKDYERFDLISYLCGRSPVRASRTTWISTEAPHKEYTGGRRLEVDETHLDDVEDLVILVYKK